MSAAAAAQAVNPVNRAAENRRRAAILFAIIAAAALPLIALVTQFAVAVLLMLIGVGADLSRGVEFAIAGAAILIAYTVSLYLLYTRASWIVLWAAEARRAGRMEAHMTEQLDEAAKRAGLPVPRLFIIERAAPNCLAAGRDPHHAVIAVTAGFLDLLTPEERSVVLAHEFAHIASFDIRVSTLAASGLALLRLPWDVFGHIRRWAYRRAARQAVNSPVVSVTLNYARNTLYFAFLLAWGLPLWSLLYWFGDREGLIFKVLSPSAVTRAAEQSGNLLWLMLVPVWALCLAPLLAPLLRRAVPVEREYLCDTAAVWLTGTPDDLVRAFAKLKGARSQHLDAHRAIGHLFLVDPAAHALGMASPTHPRIEDRIARLGASGATVSAHDTHLAEEVGASHTGRDLQVSSAPHGRSPGRAASSSVGNEFVLTAPADLLEEPRVGSSVVAHLAAGASVVLFQRSGRFVQALADDGRYFGHLRSDAPMRRAGD